jgi:mono/diheme cytochrome c family protein
MGKWLVCGCLAFLIAVFTWTIGQAADDPGQHLYEANCRQCHGAEGRGGKGPRLVPFTWSYAEALELIRHPICDMPPIPAAVVSDAEVAQIVAYLKTIK